MLRFEMCVEFYKKGSTHRYMLLQVGAGRNVATDFRFASETFAQHFKLMIHFGNRKKPTTSYDFRFAPVWVIYFVVIIHIHIAVFLLHTELKTFTLFTPVSELATPTALHFHPLMHTEVKEVFRLIAPRVNHFPHTHGTFQRNFTPKWQKNIFFTQMISYFLRI